MKAHYRTHKQYWDALGGNAMLFDEVTIGNARIIHGDCMEFMRGLPDKANSEV